MLAPSIYPQLVVTRKSHERTFLSHIILFYKLFRSTNSTTEAARISNIIIGAIKSAALVNNKNKNRPAVMPYARGFVGKGGLPFSKDTLATQIQLAAGLGAEGVILWGSSSDYHGGGCAMIEQQLKSFAGATVEKCILNREACASEHCSGHGRCVDVGLQPLDETCTNPPEAGVACRCDLGFAAPNCASGVVVSTHTVRHE